MADTIFKEERVLEGENAKWPYDTDYVEPSKVGYLFGGWKYNGTLHEPPFDNIATNPFGPITELTDIYAVWDKLSIFADTNHTLIGGDGDTDADPTKLSYWAQSASGKKISAGVTLESVALDTGMLPIVFASESTAIVGGKNVKTTKVSANDVNISRYYRFKAKMAAHSLETPVIEIEQVGKDMTILPEFDFLTFRYNWSESDGKDLDTATFVTDTKIVIEKTGNLLDTYPVGFGCNGSSSIDPDYNYGSSPSTNPELFAEISKYIKGGGDNTQSGNESALINWKEICNRDFITQGITRIYCELYANWYVSRSNGNCSVTFQTWKTDSGTGGMQLDRDESGKTKYTFSPTGDTVSKTTTTINGNVYAYSSTNASNRKFSPTGDEKGFYSHVATLVYDIKAKSAILYNRMGTRTGRNISSAGVVNGTTINGNNSGVLTTDSRVISNAAYTHTITLGEWYNTINGVKNPVCVKESDIEIAYYKYGDDPVQEGFGSYTVTKNADGHVASITVKIEKNSTGKSRECDISIKGTHYTADDTAAQQVISFRTEYKQNA